MPILIVDDDPILRGFVRLVFDLELKIFPLTASGGEEALRILAVKPVQVVITDLNMPVMNGIQLMNKIKHTYPQVHVIIMSGSFAKSQVDPQDLIHQGAAATIEKDEITSRLVKIVRPLLKL